MISQEIASSSVVMHKRIPLQNSSNFIPESSEIQNSMISTTHKKVYLNE
jgi:hypothetical protein